MVFETLLDFLMKLKFYLLVSMLTLYVIMTNNGASRVTTKFTEWDGGWLLDHLVLFSEEPLPVKWLMQEPGWIVAFIASKT